MLGLLTTESRMISNEVLPACLPALLLDIPLLWQARLREIGELDLKQPLGELRLPRRRPNGFVSYGPARLAF